MCVSVYMQHPCRTGGATKLFCNMALPCSIPLRLQMVVWGPGSCIFFFSYKDLVRILMGFFLTRILMIKRFWKTPSLRVARSLLLWLLGWWLCFSSTSAPQCLKDMLVTVQGTAAECLSAEQSAPQEKGSQTEWTRVRSTRPESIFFFVLIFFCFWRWNMEKKSRYPLKPQKIQMEEGIAWRSQCIYWVGQKACSGFSVRSYGKTWMNLLANPIHAFSSPSGTRVIIVFMNWNLISPFPRGL